MKTNLSLTRRNFNETNKKYFNYLLSKENWDELYNINDTNLEWNFFINTFCFLLDSAFPKVKCRKHSNSSKPWITKGIKISSQKLRTLDMAKKRGDLTEIELIYLNKYKIAYKRLLKTRKKLQNGNIINKASNSAKALWYLVRKELNLHNNKNSPNIEIQHENTIIKDRNRIAEIFNKYFTSVAHSNPIISNNGTQINYLSSNQNSMFLNPVTLSELENIINRMKNKWSTGIDEIPPVIIKEYSKLIVEPLQHIINLSLTTGIFPNILKTAIIKPLYKKGNVNSIQWGELQTNFAITNLL